MKSICRYLALLTIVMNVHSRDVIVLTYREDNSTINFLRDEFKKNRVPEEVIKYVRKEDPCKNDYKNAILHMCIKDNDLFVVNQNKEILKFQMQYILQ